MADSFLFYDLETFGQDPRRTRISQYAAIRTDADLNEIDTPVSFFVRPADDLLPSPMATLVTGITPQQALAEGISEAEAFDRINEQLSRPGTCALGYNTLRFDDEFVRYGLFRNFHDPYEREWRNGNSRWDLLDMLRLMRAMRPDGIQWPLREDGATSFKLEHLAEANNVREGDAHEALSDVRATIGMARLFKQSQPRLWDYALKLRDKRFVGSLLDVAAMKPVLHISMRYPASRLCAAPVLPLSMHPTINNRVIVFDLEGDIDDLLELPAEVIAQRLYMRASELPEGATRVPLKEVQLNKVPALIAWNHLRADDHARLGLDVAAIEARAERLRAFAPSWPRRHDRSTTSRAWTAWPTSMPRCTTAFSGPATSHCWHWRAPPCRSSWQRSRGVSATRDCRSCCSATVRATIPTASHRVNASAGRITAASACWGMAAWANSTCPSTSSSSTHWLPKRPTTRGARPCCNRCATGASTCRRPCEHLFLGRQLQVPAQPGAAQRQGVVQRSSPAV